jgi:hypothetical protein
MVAHAEWCVALQAAAGQCCLTTPTCCCSLPAATLSASPASAAAVGAATGALSVASRRPSADMAAAHTPAACGCRCVAMGWPVAGSHTTSSDAAVPASAVTRKDLSSGAARHVMLLQWPCERGVRACSRARALALLPRGRSSTRTHGTSSRRCRKSKSCRAPDPHQHPHLQEGLCAAGAVEDDCRVRGSVCDHAVCQGDDVAACWRHAVHPRQALCGWCVWFGGGMWIVAQTLQE